MTAETAIYILIDFKGVAAYRVKHSPTKSLVKIVLFCKILIRIPVNNFSVCKQLGGSIIPLIRTLELRKTTHSPFA